MAAFDGRLPTISTATSFAATSSDAEVSSSSSSWKSSGDVNDAPTLERLPEEMLLHILRFGDPKTAGRLGSTCRGLRDVLRGESANWGYWKDVYRSAAYADSLRVWFAKRQARALDGGSADNALSWASSPSPCGCSSSSAACVWDSDTDFFHAAARVYSMDLTGLWFVRGRHATGMKYGYHMHIVQQGRWIFACTAKPFISVSVGKLTGNLLTMKQHCLSADEYVEENSPMHLTDRENDVPMDTDVPMFSGNVRNTELQEASFRRPQLLDDDDEAAEGFLFLSSPPSGPPLSEEEGDAVGIVEQEEEEEVAPFPSRRWMRQFLKRPEIFYDVPASRWKWFNICSALVDASEDTDGRMWGSWMQDLSGFVFTSDANAGRFEAVRVGGRQGPRGH